MSQHKTLLLRCIIWPLAYLPLPVVHGLGIALGWFVYMVSGRYSQRMRENLQLSGIALNPQHYRTLLHKNIAESGKAMLETLAIWQRSEQKLLSWVRSCEGWQHIEEALQRGKGIVFLTPHLGCFEMTSIYYGAHHPVTVLYKPPKQSWILPLMQQGRTRGQVSLAPANTQGVRALMQALKRCEAIGILPDQVPSTGEGEHALYFGRPAYTMLLASRIATKTGATVLTAFGERLSWGRGYRIHFKPVAHGADDTGIDTTQQLNHVIETEVRLCPEQYLWSYNRYK
jgi:Kdo2-lipid IVA lauroyltransferase/acyltransferase